MGSAFEGLLETLGRWQKSGSCPDLEVTYCPCKPVFFEDIGEAARNLLEHDFNVGIGLLDACFSPQGTVAMRARLQSHICSGKTEAGLQMRYYHCSKILSETYTTNNSTLTELRLQDWFLYGSSFRIAMGFRPDNSRHHLTSELRLPGKSLLLAMRYDSNVIQSSLMIPFRFHIPYNDICYPATAYLGGSFSYNFLNNSLMNYCAGWMFRMKCLSISSTITPYRIDGNIFTQLSQSCKMAVRMSSDLLFLDIPQMRIGVSYRIDTDTLFKLRFSSFSEGVICLQRRFHPSIIAAFTLSNKYHNNQVGIGLKMIF